MVRLSLVGMTHLAILARAAAESSAFGAQQLALRPNLAFGLSPSLGPRPSLVSARSSVPVLRNGRKPQAFRPRVPALLGAQPPFLRSFRSVAPSQSRKYEEVRALLLLSSQ